MVLHSFAASKTQIGDAGFALAVTDFVETVETCFAISAVYADYPV
jgi:hypothetical protein